ncbi:DGQHR domain-containing protein [Candidatus Zixiibacteriota bacterium]
MEAKKMEIPCIAVSYGKRKCYVTALRGGYLASKDRVKIDYFRPDHPVGYQRSPNKTRYRGISRYLRSEDAYGEFLGPVMAQSIVLNCRVALTFKPSADDSRLGNLVLLDDVELYVVDGQHRVGGIRDALERSEEIESRLFPVIITDGMDYVKEAIHFYLINTSQVKVSTDIAQRILASQSSIASLWQEIQTQGKAWIKKALEIVDIVNEKPDQPWYHKIKIPMSEHKRTMVSQNAFANSLRPLLNHSLYKERDSDVVSEMIARYWLGIQELVPEAFEKPRAYLLQKTLGLYTMHNLMPSIIDRVVQQGKKVTPESLQPILSDVLDEGASFWHGKGGKVASYGAGNKAVRLLTQQLEQKLPQPEHQEIL